MPGWCTASSGDVVSGPSGLLSLPLVSAAGRDLVYGANLLDWPRALAVAAAIGGAAILAGTSPVRHATRVNLATLLRDE